MDNKEEIRHLEQELNRLRAVHEPDVPTLKKIAVKSKYLTQFLRGDKC